MQKKFKSKRAVFLYCVILAVLLALFVLIFPLQLFAFANSLNKTVSLRYIESLQVDLADFSDQIYIGSTEKYVLKDQYDKLWLFKVNFKQDDRLDINIADNVTKLLGINSPTNHDFSIVINDKMRAGTLQQILPEETEFHLDINSLDINKYPQFAFPVFKSIISSWILDAYDNAEEIELAHTPKGILYQIDLNEAFDNCDQAANKDKNCLFNIDSYLKLANHEIFRMGIKSCNLKGYLNYLKSINDNWFADYIQNSLTIDFDQSILDHKIKIMLMKKDHILEYLDNQLISSKYSSKYDNYTTSFQLLKNALNPKHLLSFFKPKNKARNNFSAIASGKAWWIINSQLEYDESKMKLSDTEKIKMIEVAYNKLNTLRRSIKRIEEKIAITLYLRQLRTLMQYVSTFHDYSAIDDGSILYLVYSKDELDNRNKIDQWQKYITYQSKGYTPIVKESGEREYLEGLLNLLDNKYKEAGDMLLKAKKNNYAVEEINNLLESII